MIKSLEFFFVLVKSYEILPAIMEKALFLHFFVFFKVSIDHLFDNL